MAICMILMKKLETESEVTYYYGNIPNELDSKNPHISQVDTNIFGEILLDKETGSMYVIKEFEPDKKAKEFYIRTVLTRLARIYREKEYPDISPIMS